MGLGVDQRQARPPGAAEDRPAVDAAAPRGSARCRRRDPRWCCSRRRRWASSGRSRAGRTGSPGNAPGRRTAASPASSRRPGRRAARPPARRRAGRTARRRPDGRRASPSPAGGTARSGDRVRCGAGAGVARVFLHGRAIYPDDAQNNRRLAEMSATQKPPVTVDAAEVAKFEAMAAEWWDPNGKFKPLHMLNPCRLDYIVDQIAAEFGRDPKRAAALRGLAAARHRLRRRAPRRADGAARRRRSWAWTRPPRNIPVAGCTRRSPSSRSTTATAPPRTSPPPASASTWC